VIPLIGPYDPAEVTADTIIKYRQDMLTAIITVFGVWIGAGAAYFFGKENLRVATDSILKMREQSIEERIRNIFVKDINPRRIEKTFKLSDTLDTLYQVLQDKPDWWFFVVVNENGKFVTTLDEEALYIYISEMKSKGDNELKEKLKGDTVATLIKYLKEKKSEKYSNVHIEITMDFTVGLVNDLMLKKRIFLGIIIDKDEIPTHYFTPDDIRRCMLNL
jgi:hypothetical protein